MTKKILCTVLCLCVFGAGYAATTCVHPKTKIFTLKKSVNGTSTSYDRNDFTWTVTFGYDLIPNDSSSRKITGAATCNEISTNADGGAAKMGDANGYLRASNADMGTYCWCSLVSPVSSWWVFYKSYSDESECASNCARDCAAAVSADTNKFRSSGVYMAIW